MITNEQYNQLEAYLFGQMNEQDRLAFEAELKMNAELSAELKIHQLEHSAMKIALQEDLRDQLKSWNKEQESGATNNQEERGKIRFLNSRVILVAASILLLVGFFGQIWINSNFNNSALLGDTTKFRSAAMRGETRGAAIESIYTAIDVKDYKTALRLLTQIDTVDFSFEVLRAEANFQLKNYSQAEIHLKNAIRVTKNPSEKQFAEWTMAIVYIDSNQDHRAKTQLEEIIKTPNHNRAEDAQTMLKKLNSFWRKLAW